MRYLFFIGCFILFSSYSNSYIIDRTIEINIKSSKTKGNLFLAIYKDSNSYMDENKAIKKVIIPVHNYKCNYKFTTTYSNIAIAVFHDLNSNEKLDKNLFGYPTEPFGFSNNASGYFGPPSFSAAAIDLSTTSSVTINL